MTATLRAMLSAVSGERSAVRAPRTFPYSLEINSAVNEASDHAAVWVDLL